MKKTLALIVVGGLLGGVAVFYGQAPARRALGMEGRDVDAVVVEERQEDDGRLVLVLRADEDTFLASFRERADDVASLVSVGDRVTMRTPRDGVFADDAPILRVQRSETPEADERLAANAQEVVEVGADGLVPLEEPGTQGPGEGLGEPNEGPAETPVVAAEAPDAPTVSAPGPSPATSPVPSVAPAAAGSASAES